MDLKVFLTVFTTVFLAELGDKTQLATVLYAADASNPKLTVLLGASTALVLSATLGVLAGGLIARYVPPHVLTRIAGVGFVLLGAWTIARG